MAKILLVEDEPSDRELIGAMLTEGGHEVLHAADGKEALAQLEREHLDVVVTDLRMPGINGLRLIRELRDEGDDIPIVAVSGKNADQLHLAEDYGAIAGFMKPVDRGELLAAVDRALAHTKEGWTDAWIHPDPSGEES